MKELKNLLVLKSNSPIGPEEASRIEETLAPLLESTNSELVITNSDQDAQLHPAAAIVERMDRLCGSIEQLVEVNQAMLAYMIDLDGLDKPEVGGSLDG